MTSETKLGEVPSNQQARELRLQRARLDERFRSLVAQTAEVAVVTDAATNVITYVSPAVTRLFGWRPEELVGRPGRSLVHPDDLHVFGVSSVGRRG